MIRKEVLFQEDSLLYKINGHYIDESIREKVNISIILS
jgi:hypothetical protein